MINLLRPIQQGVAAIGQRFRPAMIEPTPYPESLRRFSSTPSVSLPTGQPVNPFPSAEEIENPSLRSITPELLQGAPTSSGPRPQLRPVNLDDELDSAQIVSDVAPQYRNLASVNVPRPDMPDHSNDAPRGWLGNTGHRLEHIGKGFLLAGIPGAVAGGVSPRFIDRAIHNSVTVPQWQREQEFASQQANQEVNRLRHIADMTGYDPISGTETPDTKLRRIAERDRRDQREVLAEYRRNQQEDRARANEDRLYNNWLQHGDRKRPLTETEATRMGRPELKGQLPPARPMTAGERPRYGHVNRVINGKVHRIQINEDTGEERDQGEINEALAKDPSEMTESERRQNLSNFDSRVANATELKRRFEDAKAKTTQLDAKARQLHNAFEAQKQNEKATGRPTDSKDALTQDDVDAAWQMVEAARNEMRGAVDDMGAFADIVEVGADGTSVSLRKGEIDRQRGEMSRTRSNVAPASSGLKVGDTVTVKGKQVRISKVYPDGSFDIE